MSSSVSYFNTDIFVDGTGRGKISRQIKSNLEPPSAPKIHHRKREVVSIDVPLPLPAQLDHHSPIFIPCEQFPLNYNSLTCLSILHWSKYHGRNVSFYLKDIGYFSTADRSDHNRCREDFRYLKRLIYNIDDIRELKQLKIEFDLNIGSAYLNPCEPSTSLDALLWWINRHRTTLLDKKGR